MLGSKTKRKEQAVLALLPGMHRTLPDLLFIHHAARQPGVGAGGGRL